MNDSGPINYKDVDYDRDGNVGDRYYDELVNNIFTNGEKIYNERTGKNTYSIPFSVYVHKAGTPEPIVTRSKVNWRAACAEIVGYILGFDNAQQFADIGTNTWFDNANVTKAWLENPARKGEDDLGMIYGGVAKNYPVLNPADGMPSTIDLWEEVVDSLSKGIDDRHKIVTFMNPGVYHLGSLRPCVHTHQFILHGNKLNLSSVQRSTDTGLGLKFNLIQIPFLMKLIAQITGLEHGDTLHLTNHVHIYGDHVDILRDKLSDTKLGKPGTLVINPEIKSLDDLKGRHIDDIVTMVDYEHGPWIKLPFSA